MDPKFEMGCLARGSFFGDLLRKMAKARLWIFLDDRGLFISFSLNLAVYSETPRGYLRSNRWQTSLLKTVSHFR